MDYLEKQGYTFTEYKGRFQIFFEDKLIANSRNKTDSLLLAIFHDDARTINIL